MRHSGCKLHTRAATCWVGACIEHHRGCTLAPQECILDPQGLHSGYTGVVFWLHRGGILHRRGCIVHHRCCILRHRSCTLPGAALNTASARTLAPQGLTWGCNLVHRGCMHTAPQGLHFALQWLHFGRQGFPFCCTRGCMLAHKGIALCITRAAFYHMGCILPDNILGMLPRSAPMPRGWGPWGPL